MSDAEITVKLIPRAGLDPAWLVQGRECYAVIEADGTKKTYAKGGKKPGEPFKAIADAVASWCEQSQRSTTLKP